ncbi:hypothetical protein C8R43DRAFT_947313 [Mycena crocata]|nr:hypothetical protein C8R43DRAFT_947313 [Mycena crocata]
MNGALDFPPELQDAIIDHMHGDKSALGAFGLVNKSWLRSSRLHLFESVTLRDHNSQKFLQLARSPHATFVHSIDSISISRSRDDADLGVSFNELISQLPPFPALRCLRLSHIHWTGVSQTSVDSLAVLFANITQFDLHLVTFDTPHQLFALISRFCRLQRTSLNANFLSIPSTQLLVDAPEVPSSLEFMRFRTGLNTTSNPAGHLAAWLCSSDRSPAIRVLELGIVAATSLPSVGALLRALGPELHDFDLGLMHHVTAAQIATHIDLSQNISLKRLTIHLSLRRFLSATATQHAPWALLAAPRSTIEMLTIVLKLDSIDILDNLDWVHLNAVLTAAQFSSLQRLQFIVHCSSVVDTVAGAIRDRLPEYAALGVVEVSVLHSSRAFTQGPTWTSTPFSPST